MKTLIYGILSIVGGAFAVILAYCAEMAWYIYMLGIFYVVLGIIQINDGLKNNK